MANVLEFVKKNLTKVVVIGVAAIALVGAGTWVLADRLAYAAYEKSYDEAAEELRATFPAVPKEVLMKRLRNIKERGVVLRQGESFEDMFTARTRLYEKYADVTISEEGSSIEDTLRAVRDSLSELI